MGFYKLESCKKNISYLLAKNVLQKELIEYIAQINLKLYLLKFNGSARFRKILKTMNKIIYQTVRQFIYIFLNFLSVLF